VCVCAVFEANNHAVQLAPRCMMGVLGIRSISLIKAINSRQDLCSGGELP